MNLISNLGGRKFAISVFGVLVLILYMLLCMNNFNLVQIAVPFCTALGSIVASFCAINMVNDYVAMKREGQNASTNNTTVIK